MLATDKSNTIKALISKASTDSYITYDFFFSEWCVKRIWWHEKSNNKSRLLIMTFNSDKNYGWLIINLKEKH